MSEYSAFISTTIAAISTLYVSRRNIFSPHKITVAKEQLYKVYLPLFKFLEPYLYKKDVEIDILTNFIDLFESIKSNHYELIDSNLLLAELRLKKSLDDKNYINENYECLCSVLDELFESNRRKLFLPTRKFSYKLYTEQLTNETKYDLSQLKGFLVELIQLAFLITIFIVIYMIANLLITCFNSLTN